MGDPFIYLLLYLIMSASSSFQGLRPIAGHPDGCQCDSCTSIIVPRANMAFNRAVRSSFNGMKPIRVKLFSVSMPYTSAAAGAISVMQPFQFTSANFPEITSFISLYDQCRVLNCKLHYFAYVSTAPTAVPNISTMVITLQFDPNAPAPGGVTTGLTESHNSGLMMITPGVNGTSAQSSFYHLPYKTLSASSCKLAPVTGSDNPGSAWFTVNASTSVNIVNVGVYSTALGTAGIIALQQYMELDVEFKLRT